MKIYLRKKTVWPFIMSVYIDLTEKTPLVVNFQTKTSGSSVKLTLIRRWSSSNYTSHLSVDKVLLNSIFRGLLVRTSETRTFLRRTMLYNEGYCLASGWSPNHMSSQKRVFWPLPTLEEPSHVCHWYFFQAKCKYFTTNRLTRGFVSICLHKNGFAVDLCGGIF
jgi:hypothetical protein